jgi:hypothetical protein
MDAITSGRVAPSNWWRAAEIAQGVRRADIPEATELTDALHVYGPKVADAE